MPNLRGVFLLAASMLLCPSAASAQAQNMPSCTSAIQVLFDKYGMTHIPAGSTIWFTSVLKAVHTADGSAITSPIRIRRESIAHHVRRVAVRHRDAGQYGPARSVDKRTPPVVGRPGEIECRLFAVSGFAGSALRCSAVRGAGGIHSAFQRSRNVDRNVHRVAPGNHYRLGLERSGLFAVRPGWDIQAQAAFRAYRTG